MRCNNCGWENPSTNTVCEKCHTPLAGAAQVNNPHIEVSPLNKTINEAAIFAPKSQEEHSATIGEQTDACPHCGYPLRPDTAFCPQCGEPIRKANPVASMPKPAPKPAATPQSAPNHMGTVNPWIQVTPQSRCTLTPVSQSTDEAEPAPLTFKGDTPHNLNRANLDAENPTITSQSQAELTCTDGVWYIQDRSAQHTTFIHAAEKTALQDGDVILMGNRQFVFHTDK